MVVISNWAGEYAFLRNDFPCDVTATDGKEYPSVEHAFQAAKLEFTTDFKPGDDRDPNSYYSTTKELIREAQSAREAKRIGQGISIDEEEWNRQRLPIMEDLVRRKFRQNVNLASMLQQTGDQEIVMKYRDAFWGDGGDGSGHDHSGRILMKIRAEYPHTLKTWQPLAWDGTSKHLKRPARKAQAIPPMDEQPDLRSRAREAGRPETAPPLTTQTTRIPNPAGPDSVVVSPEATPGVEEVRAVRDQARDAATRAALTRTLSNRPAIPLPPSSKPAAPIASTASAVADSDVKTTTGYKGALDKICGGGIDDI